MEEHFLGPMDPAAFMDAFMPVNGSGMGGIPDGVNFNEVYNQSSEKGMYGPFIEIANRVCTNFVAIFTGDRGDSETSLKPDITFLSKNSPAVSADFGGASPATSFQHMEMFVEFKLDTQSDPFQDKISTSADSTIGRNSIEGKKTRGQCALYAANQLAYQHRLFSFSLVICGRRARFFRWDREGVVVSAGIDCSTRYDLVIEFLRRFNQMTSAQRGLDPTATPATPAEIEAFEFMVAGIEIEPLKKSVGDKAIFPRFRLEVPNAQGGVSRYVVGSALDYNLGITGRCTRGYLALDLSTNQPVFLKDMWRPDVRGIEAEHVWYEKLIVAGVPNLVKVKHGSDVVQPTSGSVPNYYGPVPLDPDETTSQHGAQQGLTHRLVELFPSCEPKLRGYVHYRMVQTELCKPLSEFNNSRHLVLVVLGSLKACVAACLNAHLFHRDASIGNIMIGLDDEGRLNDWDLCRGVDVDESLEGPRTGTWQFISVKLLEFPGSKHTLTDDLESHFFVLMWAALQWVRHDKAGQIDMKHIFDQQRSLPDGTVSGGTGKSEMYKSEDKELRGVRFACEPFNNLFWRLWEVFSDYNYDRWASLRKRGVGLDSGSGTKPAPRPEPSVSPKEMIRLFEEALQQPGWIDDDKVKDQFPKVYVVSTSSRPLPGMDTCSNGNLGKRRWASLGQDAGPRAPAKRQKME